MPIKIPARTLPGKRAPRAPRSPRRPRVRHGGFRTRATSATRRTTPPARAAGRRTPRAGRTRAAGATPGERQARLAWLEELSHGEILEIELAEAEAANAKAEAAKAAAEAALADATAAHARELERAAAAVAAASRKPSSTPLLTFAEVAASLGFTSKDPVRSVHRRLVQHGLTWTEISTRDRRLTPAQLNAFMEAMTRCSPCAGAARSTTSAARSGSAGKPAKSASTLQAAVNAKLQKRTAPSSSTRSGKNSFTVLPGGKPR